ncbi:helix-turn-helix domain-containing protein [Nocardioides sp. YIM B13467]|uniref:helix-turn-helix domain-containing protein n=1 Tax=Nocardioides sp. YIM B13467 TaxID=3366294 RepID=UPI0036701B50
MSAPADDAAGLLRGHSNFGATAARLGLHHNTIRYRLDQIAELLGRPPTERRLQLEPGASNSPRHLDP